MSRMLSRGMGSLIIPSVGKRKKLSANLPVEVFLISLFS
jgi:hypothetical protein